MNGWMLAWCYSRFGLLLLDSPTNPLNVKTPSTSTVLTIVYNASQVVAPSTVSHSLSTLKEKWKKVQWRRSNR